MVRIKFYNFIGGIFFLTIIIFNASNYCLAQEVYSTFVNRLSKITLKFESTAPVEKEPVYVLPSKTKSIANFLKCNVQEEKYLYEWDLYLFFEKEGEYNIGPFVFYDVENKAISLPLVKVLVNNTETITFDERKIKDNVDLPPKFFTVKSNENIYPLTPIYLILELSQQYEKIDIIWSGWENVFVERIPEEKIDGKNLQIKFLLVFTKSGTFNLLPIKFRVEKNNKSFLFSSSPLIYSVSNLSQDIKNNGLGDFKVKLNAYTGTNKNEVVIKTDYTGSGYFKFFIPQKPSVTNINNVFLKDYHYEAKTFYPYPSGQLSYTYYFIPKEDGNYQISLNKEKVFDPKNAVFKEISSTFFNVKVMLPGNPQEEINKEKRVANKKKIDYDFYALIIFLLLITFTIIGVSLKSFYKSRKKDVVNKNIIDSDTEDELSVILRSFLVLLSNKSGEDLLTAPFSKIEDTLYKIIKEDNLREKVINWLKDVYKTIYLEKKSFQIRKKLAEEGLNLIKNIRDI